MLFDCLQSAIHNNRISEIVIMDDASDKEVIEAVKAKYYGIEKVKIITRPANVGMHQNKRDAIFNCTNDWVIIFDSDNVIDNEYIEYIPPIQDLDPEVIYMPEYAKPMFDYRKYAGKYFDLEYTQKHIKSKDPMFDCLLNTCNYLVNRNKYLEIWTFNPAVKGADTIYFLYQWLSYGYAFHVLVNCSYFHRVHSGSGFLKDADYNMSHANEIKKQILNHE